MTQLSDKWAKLDNLGSLKALHISVHECNLLQLKQALAKKQLSSSDSLAHFDILDSRPNSSDRQDVQLYTSMISAGWSHGRTARAPSSLEASARRVVWSARRNLYRRLPEVPQLLFRLSQSLQVPGHYTQTVTNGPGVSKSRYFHISILIKYSNFSRFYKKMGPFYKKFRCDKFGN